MKHFNIQSIIARLSSVFRDFMESGQQNIMRVVFGVLIGFAAMLLTTFGMHGDVRLLHILDTMLIRFKIWIPLLVSAIVYVALSTMMRVNSDSIAERFWNNKRDENGVRYANNGTYGTAAWMTKKEAREKLEVEPIQTCNGVILGSFDDKNREVVCIPRGKKQAREITNQNVCILGSPGEGKSWGYVRCNMLQAIRRGESVIVTDPKGELFRDMSKLFRDNGYEVKVFNLANPQKSDAWNCMNVCFNKSTGNVDLNRVKIFVEAIMKNTSEGGEANDYFANNEKTLYEAVIMYMAEKYVMDLRNILENQIVKNCDAKDNGETYVKFRMKYVRHDAYLNEIIAEAKRIFIQYGPNKKLVDLITKEKLGEYVPPAHTAEERAAQFDEFYSILSAKAVKPTLSNVYNKINKLDIKKFKEEVDALKTPTALCHIPLSTILQQSENVWGNFTNGCSVRLNVLNDEVLRLMISEDDIDLSAPGVRKCAYFCIFPDQDFTFQFVSSLFFTFLFKDQIETADANNGNPVPINYILDEFCNIGMVPDFSNKISTARSRNIGITMIVQSMTQLFQVYSENVTNTILGCCSTLICLGVNDDVSIEYISKKLGEATILQSSTRKERQVGRIENIFAEFNESVGEGSRNLLTFDETRRIEATHLLVICAHLKPLKLRKVAASAHPLSNGGKFEQTSIADIPPFVMRYPGCEQRDEFAREQYDKIQKDLEKYQRDLMNAQRRNENGGEFVDEEDPEQLGFEYCEEPELEDEADETPEPKPKVVSTPAGDAPRRTSARDEIMSALMETEGKPQGKRETKNNIKPAPQKSQQKEHSNSSKVERQGELPAATPKQAPQQPPAKDQPKQRRDRGNFAQALVTGKQFDPGKQNTGRSNVRMTQATASHFSHDEEVQLLIERELAAKKAASAGGEPPVAAQNNKPAIAVPASEPVVNKPAESTRAEQPPAPQDAHTDIADTPCENEETRAVPGAESKAAPVEFIPEALPQEDTVEFIPVQEETTPTFEIVEDFTFEKEN